MKFLILIFITILSLFALNYSIKIENGKIDNFDENNFQILKCSHALNPFDTKTHYYCGTTLFQFVKKACKSIDTIKFIAYDDYEITFSKKEIEDKTIFLAFESDNKKITPRIVFTKNNYPATYIYKKSIFLIKKAICK